MSNELSRLRPYSVPEMAGGCEVEQSILTKLKRNKQHHEEQLAKINAALDALEKQPNVAELLEAVMKAI